MESNVGLSSDVMFKNIEFTNVDMCVGNRDTANMREKSNMFAIKFYHASRKWVPIFMVHLRYMSI